ncbi:MAG: NlpC/P60 family protein [Xanthomonadaceae bacterium]|nr:NlpC/P60 family protein [Xanthomonadaceae bacterium]
MRDRPRRRFFQGLLLASVVLLCSACATLPPGIEGGATGRQLAAQALALKGKPYRYGGNTPSGFDCSGLVQFVHQQAGISVPRTVALQLRHSRRVSPTALRPGDLVFFRLAGKVSHEGLYAGDGRFVHAPSTGKAVEVASLDHPYWRQRLVGAGRFY